MRKLRFKQFLRERNQFSKAGEEALLSVSEYYGVKPRAEAFGSEEHETRAATLEGYRIVKIDDLVMNYMLAWKGAYGVSNHDGIVSPAYSVFKVDQNVVDVRYLHHRVRSDEMKAYFRSRSKGIIESRLRLYPDSLLASYVDIPDLATQRRIAGFLDRETARIDLLIEKKQRLVALLEEKAKRDVSSTFEGLELEYKTWRLKHVLVAGLAYGANEPSDGDDPDDVRYIRITDIDADGNLREDTFKTLPRERVRDYLLEDGDILFARSGATVGKSFIYRDHMGDCCYAGYLIRASVNKKLIAPDFLKHLTATDQYWTHILGTNIQATIQNVSAEKYANLSFPLPPLSVQEQVSERVIKNDERHASTKRRGNASINRLKEYRSALITAAVTGQIDVQTYAKSGTPGAPPDAIQEAMGT